MDQLAFLPTLPSLLAAPKMPLIHRDLSWLQFNERVLGEARQSKNPLLERAKFLSITSSNLDEFFMIRFSSVNRSIVSAGKSNSPSLRFQLNVRDSILESVAEFCVKQLEALDVIAGEFESHGVKIVRRSKEGDPAFEIGKRVFESEVLPKLSPPEPFSMSKLSTIENLQIAAVIKGGLFFKIPRNIPASFTAPSDDGSELYFFFLDDLLGAHLKAAFRLNASPALLRLTRDSDFTIDLDEEDTESIPDAVRSGVRKREGGRPLRIQYSGDTDEAFLNQCVQTLKILPSQVFPASTSLVLHGLWGALGSAPEKFMNKPELVYAPLVPVVPLSLDDPDKIFEKIKEHDLLLHHPYDSFDGFVKFIQAACLDPNVTMIEQTVYRMDALSPIMEALKKVGTSKKVRVIIELRARFDELNNLRLADELRKSGVEVAFGFGNLKVHAKIALVTRTEEGGVKRYTHLSTGNYNANTARMYTDLAILTENPEIGQDARHFFDSVLKGQVPVTFKTLVSAPTRLHKRLLGLIDAETEAAKQGNKARIVAKVNTLVDAAVIDQLYKASQAGVQVDLIVRGACSLIPGVKGLSENIKVVSIVDRYLEHSRIYYFAHSKALYLSSADWMPRNFFSRLELAFPVLDADLYKYIVEVLIPTYLQDTVKAKELTPQGLWKKRTGGRKQIRAQFHFVDLAKKSYRDTPLQKLYETAKAEVSKKS